MKLDAKSAAEKIHLAVASALAPSAEDRHTAAFVSEVCSALGIEDSPEHHNVVLAELVKAGIEPHNAAEWPKWVDLHQSLYSKNDDGSLNLPDWADEYHVDRKGRVTVLVDDEQEEDRATTVAKK